jgi:hypothetical protein
VSTTLTQAELDARTRDARYAALSTHLLMLRAKAKARPGEYANVLIGNGVKLAWQVDPATGVETFALRGKDKPPSEKVLRTCFELLPEKLAPFQIGQKGPAVIYRMRETAGCVRCRWPLDADAKAKGGGRCSVCRKTGKTRCARCRREIEDDPVFSPMHCHTCAMAAGSEETLERQRRAAEQNVRNGAPPIPRVRVPAGGLPDHAEPKAPPDPGGSVEEAAGRPALP